MKKTVFVGAGMSFPKSEIIIDNAKRLGKILADYNYTYVQGGSADGLMGVTLKEFVKHSKNVEFLIPKIYFDYDEPKLKQLTGDNCGTYKMVLNEGERLQQIKNCDYVVILPGGTGTIEELLYVNETMRASEHNAKIILVNADNYYLNLLNQFEKNISEGLSKKSAFKFEIITDVCELLNIF